MSLRGALFSLRKSPLSAQDCSTVLGRLPTLMAISTLMTQL